MNKVELLYGTLDLLILKVLARGELHGYGVARKIQEDSGDVLRVEEGSLYPALHRMERRGWIESHWGPSETNRRAKYYRLTEAGRAQLETEAGSWQLFSRAVGRVLGTA